MQTSFTLAQLANLATAEADSILRSCVHCGFCTATCPTYVTLGNELDSPRGRIYLIKDMLENDRPADKVTVTHIDRCLSCFACMTTCPSGVNYMHLVDHAREHIEKTYRRPIMDRLIRATLAAVLPYPNRFKTALKLAQFGHPFISTFEKVSVLKPLAAMLKLAPKTLPVAAPFVPVKLEKPIARVAILGGCAQSVLDPGINATTRRLLNRLNIEVVSPKGEGCCGALTQHMGKHDAALAFAKNNVDVWTREIENGGLDAIIVTTSGCGTTIKDYGHMLRLDAAYKDKAAKISALAKDITEFLSELELPAPKFKAGVTVAYHSACSLQHGQKVTKAPKDLLTKAGFVVKEPAEGHLCCGSAGTYNIMQSDIATQLRDRKVKNIKATGAVIIAAGNLGCMKQIGAATNIPIVHTVELLDWAYGGEKPASLQ